MVSSGFATIILPLTSAEIHQTKNKRGGTCGEVFIDRPVVHLQGGVTPVPGESDQMVFAIVYGRGCLLNADVHCPDVERHTHFALFLEKTQREDEQKKMVV